jgi:hypothetical protein
MRLVFGAFALCGVATLAHADDSVVAKVPFAFVVGTSTLPAGDYVITRNATHPELVSIAKADGAQTTLVLTRGAAEIDKEQPALSFERIGKVVYLTEVTLGPGNSREIRSVPSAADVAPRR